MRIQNERSIYNKNKDSPYKQQNIIEYKLYETLQYKILIRVMLNQYNIKQTTIKHIFPHNIQLIFPLSYQLQTIHNFYLYSISPHNKMSNHQNPLNNSPSKQKYSFSKEHRFRQGKPLTDAYYLPSFDHDRRSAIIGYGERSLGIVHTQKVYEGIPHAYNIPSTLEIKRGNAFKGGRYQIGSYLENLKYLQSIPGPSYTTPSTLERRAASMKDKLPDFSLKGILGVPGPGAYSVPSTLKVQKQKNIMDSKFTNPGQVKISQSLQISRRKQPVVFAPGPGQYDIQKYGIGNPQNPFGKNQNTKMPRSLRDPVGKKDGEKMPGPGAYKIYSQFE